MKQSRFMSLIEAVANVALGYGIAVVTQLIVFPWFGLPAHVDDALAIGAIFTLVSVARSFALRRLFESSGVLGPRFLVHAFCCSGQDNAYDWARLEMPMPNAVWKIEGSDGFRAEMPGGMSATEIEAVLQRLVCRHLSQGEVVSASLRRNHAGYSPLLERVGTGSPLQFGESPFFTARLADSG